MGAWETFEMETIFKGATVPPCGQYSELRQIVIQTNPEAKARRSSVTGTQSLSSGVGDSLALQL